jgi:hypothetical protein
VPEISRLRVRSCRCRNSWCPKCFPVWGLSRVKTLLGKFEWDKVRHIVLTVDPLKYEDGFDAWRSINSRAVIRDMIRNLRRYKGRGLGFWMWFLEWHRNGFPHWHLLVETDVVGRGGMIGQEALHGYWREGRIRESYFKSQYHWDMFSGYIKKHGYIEKRKKQQGELPAWALEYKGRIRRFDGSHVKVGKDGGEEMTKRRPKRDWVREWERQQSREWLRAMGGKSYRVILEDCGAFCNMEIEYMGQMGSYYQVQIALGAFKEVLGGRYYEGQGWVIECFGSELKDFLKRFEADQVLRFVEYAEAHG